MSRNNIIKRKNPASKAKMKASSVINKIIGKNLRAYRNSKHLSQEKFSETLGVSVARLRNYELGKGAIPSDILYKACEFFNVSFETMLRTEVDKRSDINRMILQVGLQKSEEISLYLSSNYPDLSPEEREMLFCMILAHYIAPDTMLKRLTGVLLRVYKKLYAYDEKYKQSQA